MDNGRLWFARLVAIYAVAIFAFLAFLYIAEPLAHIAQFGIAVDGVTPLQPSELRDEGLSWLLFVAALAAHPVSREHSGSSTTMRRPYFPRGPSSFT